MHGGGVDAATLLTALSAAVHPRMNNDHTLTSLRSYEQALVCLSNREIVDASRGRPFHYKMANDRSITDFSLIVLA